MDKERKKVITIIGVIDLIFVWKRNGSVSLALNKRALNMSWKPPNYFNAPKFHSKQPFQESIIFSHHTEQLQQYERKGEILEKFVIATENGEKHPVVSDTHTFSALVAALLMI